MWNIDKTDKIWLFSMETKKSKNMYYMETWKVNSVLVHWFLLIVFIQRVIFLFTPQTGKIKSFSERVLLSFSIFQGKTPSVFHPPCRSSFAYHFNHLLLSSLLAKGCWPFSQGQPSKQPLPISFLWLEVFDSPKILQRPEYSFAIQSSKFYIWHISSDDILWIFIP